MYKSSFKGTEYRNIEKNIFRYSVPLKLQQTTILQILRYSVPMPNTKE
jgi:hypothetical protein